MNMSKPSKHLFLIICLALQGFHHCLAWEQSETFETSGKRVLRGYAATGERMFYVRLSIIETVKVADKMKKSRLTCGGTIIAQDLVLTAAHCFLDPRIEPNLVSLKVVVQYGNWTEPGRRPKPDFFPIFKDDKKLPVEEPSTFKRHPRYDPKLKLFDIAYIKFSTPVFKKEHVLPPCSQTKTNKHLKMTGMGDVIVPNKGAVPLQLQEVDVKEFELSGGSCLKPPCSPCGPNYDRTYHVCYELSTGVGDSGGPVFAVDSPSHNAEAQCLYGVVSLFHNPGNAERAERVSLYSDWIKQAMAPLN